MMRTSSNTDEVVRRVPSSDLDSRDPISASSSSPSAPPPAIMVSKPSSTSLSAKNQDQDEENHQNENPSAVEPTHATKGVESNDNNNTFAPTSQPPPSLASASLPQQQQQQQAPWYKEDKDGYPLPTPLGESEQDQASWYEWISFSWVSRMMLTADGRDKNFEHLTIKDLVQLPEWEQPAVTRERFREFWEEGELKPENREPGEEPSLLRALFRSQRWNLVSGGICRFGADSFTVATFYVLREFLRFLNDPGKPAWHGWPWLLALVLCNLGNFFFHNAHFHFTQSAFEQMRGVCQVLIFDSVLGYDAEHQLSGKVTAAHGSDTTTLVELFQFYQYLFCAPILFIVSVVSLGIFVGWSGPISVIVLFACATTQAILMTRGAVHRAESLNRVDKRASLLNELFQGIKVVKFMNWQENFLKNIVDARAWELEALGKYRLFFNFIFNLSNVATHLMYLTAFAVAVKGFEIQISPENLFPALVVLNSLRFPLMFGGLAGAKLGESKAAVERIQSCVLGQERYDFLDKCFDSDAQKNDLAAEMKNVTVLAEPGSKEVVAKNLSVKVHKGLTVILGKVASGKTTLLKALTAECAGDLHYDASQEKGFLRHYQRAALIPQEKFIKNATIKENIVMCEEFDEKRYKEALRVSQLEPDLKELTHGDNTEVGAKGVTLSGGQCSRLQIARAVYSNRDFVIADDPLSAVDPHVANSLVNEVFCGPAMKGKTVLLVTHMTQLASKADRIIYMEDCEVDFDGTLQDFKDLGYDVEEIAQELAEEERQIESFRNSFGVSSFALRSPSNNNSLASRSSYRLSPQKSLGDQSPQRSGSNYNLQTHLQRQSPGGKSSSMGSFSSFRQQEMQLQAAATSSPSSKQISQQASLSDVVRGGTQLMSAEERATGSVSIDTYLWYIKLCGKFWFYVSVALTLSSDMAYGVVNLILAGVAAPNEEIFSSMKNFTVDDYILWIGIFVLIGSVLLLTRTYTFYKTNVLSAGATQAGMVSGLMRAPMSFFDTTPVGRINNRCLLDQLTVDIQVTDNVMFVVGGITFLAVTFAITIISTYYVAILIPFLLAYYIFTYLRYAGAARGLKRLENTSRSPMMAIMNEVCGGLASIRTYGLEKELSKEHVKRTALSQQTLYAVRNAQRWLQARTDFVGSLMIFFVGGFAVLARHVDSDALPLTPSLTAIGLTNCISATMVFSFLTRQMSDLECQMSSLEAISEYTHDIAQEATLEYDGEKNKAPAENWPAENPSVEFKDVCLRYRPGLPLVLKKVSFSIKPLTRSALVGRSGSSKSTALLALFRIVEIESGSILVDNRDITRTLDTRDWRSRITIIPQDPLLFTGTIRQNLDPFGQFSDDELWAVIDRLQLRERLEHAQQLFPEEEDEDEEKKKQKESSSREPTATESAVEMKQEEEEKQQPTSLGLQTIVQEKGQNFSLGERQLWCLCRCLLKKTPIVLLDEATASVDSDTDQLIQQVIRTEFKDCTIITIAHRIGTIIDSDQIIVMNNGEVEEDGHPAELLKNEKGAFRSMCAKLGSVQLEKLQKIAEGQESVADAAAQLANLSLQD